MVSWVYLFPWKTYIAKYAPNVTEAFNENPNLKPRFMLPMGIST